MAGARARVEVLTGKAAGMSIVIDDELVIGRLAEGAGRLADDEEISRSHARVSVDSSGLCTIEDLGSTNGTWVNGMRIATPQPLSEGDTVEVGGTTMVVREVSGPEEPAPAPPSAPPPVPAQKTTGRAMPEPAASEIVSAEPATEQDSPEEVPMAAAEAPEPPPGEITPGELPGGRAPGAQASAPVAPGAVQPPAVPSPPAAAAEAPGPLAAGSEAPAEAIGPSTLSLQLDIDLGGRTVQIRLDDATEPVRLVFDGDSWRPAPSPSIEKGNPA